jgi:threonylcarbamoyladenosine tRNA methylthiotransferase MtaB
MPENQVITFGCRLNACESAAIRRAAAAAGLEGAVIVNTCAVTAEAERQARQAIRRARRLDPQAPIIVTGCAAELSPESYAGLPGVDRVVGNRAKLSPESYRFTAATRRRQPTPFQDRPISPFAGGEGTVIASQSDERCRGYLQVQQGCDHRCTFCIIPFARGPSRSLPVAGVIAEARRLVAAGCREVVLTGVDLTAYGADLPEQSSLGRVVRRLLAAVPELPRLRLSSLDPAEIDPELWRIFAEEPRLMPHLHLSLQAGDDLILKRMRRRHSRADAIAVAARARALRPDVALGADLIAGFPTESEDMFGRSLDLVGECGLAFLHVFPYSARPGTAAARMPSLAPNIVKERARRLRAAAAAALAADLAARVGGASEVLVEGPGQGRAACYARVAFSAELATGEVRRMRLVASTGERLVGVPAP